MELSGIWQDLVAPNGLQYNWTNTDSFDSPGHAQQQPTCELAGKWLVNDQSDVSQLHFDASEMKGLILQYIYIYIILYITVYYCI